MSIRHSVALQCSLSLTLLAAATFAQSTPPEAEAPKVAAARVELPDLPIDAGTPDRGALVKVVIPIKNVGSAMPINCASCSK